MLDPVRVTTTRILLVVVSMGLFGIHGSGQNVPPANENLPNPYETIRNWGELPAGRTLGSITAIEVDRDGKSLWVAERCGGRSCAGSDVPVVLKLDESGKLQQSFGADLFLWPHGIHVDHEGNVWVTDGRGATPEEIAQHPETRGKGHQVIQFSPEGRILMRLGVAGVAGSPPNYLTEPTDIIMSPNGDIFVSEGHYGSLPDAPPDAVARISKFSKDGEFIKSWGRLGSGPGEFRTPHALVFDSRGRLFVADRGNSRIQIFDQEGNFLEEWHQFSRNSGLAMDENDILYAIDSESSPENHPGGWKEGIRIGSARDGQVRYFIPPHPGDTPEGVAGEGIAVDAAGNVYAGEVTLRGVTKYVRRDSQ